MSDCHKCHSNEGCEAMWLCHDCAQSVLIRGPENPYVEMPEEQMNKLLWCPFCGSEAILASASLPESHPRPWVATCVNNACKAEMNHETEEAVTAKWNTRYPWPPPEKDK